MKNVGERIDEYASGAFQRAKRRKSSWNIALFVLKWPCIFFWCIFFVKLVLWIPHQGALTFQEAAKHDVPMIFIVIPMFFLSIPLGMLMVNFLMFCVPPARKAFEAEAAGNKKLSFVGSQKFLIKMTLIMVVVLIPVSLFASSRIPLELIEKKCQAPKTGQVNR